MRGVREQVLILRRVGEQVLILRRVREQVLIRIGALECWVIRLHRISRVSSRLRVRIHRGQGSDRLLKIKFHDIP